MSIQFDATNLLAGMVGEKHGLTHKEIDKGRPAALEAMEAFAKASQGEVYGFPHLPFDKQIPPAVLEYAGRVRGSYDTVCLLGIGGSALGAWALDCAIRGPHPVQKPFSPRNPRLVVLDNVDPAFVQAALDSMNPRKTLVLVIAKSGDTAETLAAFLIVRQWMHHALGAAAARRIVAVTTAGSNDLAHLACREEYATFPIPQNVGGRFSVLSAVGLLPAALIGVDILKLLKGAAAMTRMAWERDLARNIPLRAALLHYLVWTRKTKSIHVAFPYSNGLWGTAFWFRQLWAESLGKATTRDGQAVWVGQTPVAALGTTDQHSQVQLYMEGPNDKVFSFWNVARPASQGAIPRKKLKLEAFDYLAGQSLERLSDCERRATACALVSHNRPNCTFTLERLNEEHLGAFLQMFEFATAFTGELLNIDAFDQDGVQLGKTLTWGLMGRAGYEEQKRQYEEYEKKRVACAGI